MLVDTANALPKDKYDVTVMTVKDEGTFRSCLDSTVKYKSMDGFRKGDFLFVDLEFHNASLLSSALRNRLASLLLL